MDAHPEKKGMIKVVTVLGNGGERGQRTGVGLLISPPSFWGVKDASVPPPCLNAPYVQQCP